MSLQGFGKCIAFGGDDGRRNTSYFGIIIVDLSATMPMTI